MDELVCKVSQTDSTFGSFPLNISTNNNTLDALSIHKECESNENTHSGISTDIYRDYIDSRDWSSISQFWEITIMKSKSNSFELPTFLLGDENYGVNDLSKLYECGLHGEYHSKDVRYINRKNYAVRIGYIGSYYYGYQSQNNRENVSTVEEDIKKSLGYSTTCAGRTDRNVSAISQIVCFTTHKPVDTKILLENLQQTEPFASGRLRIYDCVRVPKKFNSRSSATWRRYLYAFPIKMSASNYSSSQDKLDVTSLQDINNIKIDLVILNKLLVRLENLPLPYSVYSYKDEHSLTSGMKDICTIYRAKAFFANINSDGDSNNDNQVLCVELVGSRFLRRMVRILVATAIRETFRLSGYDTLMKIPPLQLNKIITDDPEN
eukprot:gene8876-11973_t